VKGIQRERALVFHEDVYSSIALLIGIEIYTSTEVECKRKRREWVQTGMGQWSNNDSA
jgi:hypothetical protein